MNRISGNTRVRFDIAALIESMAKPTNIPLTYEIMSAFGPKGTPGYTGDIDDIDTVHYKKYEFTGSAQTIDLTSLPDPLFGTLNFTVVRTALFVNLSKELGEILTLTPDVTAPWVSWITGSATVLPSTESNTSWVGFSAPGLGGYDVTSMNRLLTLEPNGATFDAVLFIAGIKA